MLDIQSLIASLKRPQLLVRAARFGIDEYRRDRDLRRLLGLEGTPRPGDAIMQLIDLEADLNRQREENGAHYSFLRHIDTLTAIMCEARTFADVTRPRDPVT